MNYLFPFIFSQLNAGGSQSAQRIICSISTAYLQWNFFIAIQPARQVLSQEDGNPLNFFEERPWHEGRTALW